MIDCINYCSQIVDRFYHEMCNLKSNKQLVSVYPSCFLKTTYAPPNTIPPQHTPTPSNQPQNKHKTKTKNNTTKQTKPTTTKTKKRSRQITNERTKTKQEKKDNQRLPKLFSCSGTSSCGEYAKRLD